LRQVMNERASEWLELPERPVPQVYQCERLVYNFCLKWITFASGG
jgi:hypothetical protein